MNRLAIAAVMVALAAPAFAGSVEQQKSFHGWKVQDDCQRQARKQFPDYTAESNAKREQAARQCIAANGMPMRESIVPPSPEPAKVAD